MEAVRAGIGRTGPTATLLEWDDHIPAFEEVHGEALKATQYLDAVIVKADEARQAAGARS